VDEMIRSELQSLLEELRTVEDALALLEARQTTVRSQIQQCVAQLGGRVILPGAGQLEIIAPSATISYDRQQVEVLISELAITHAAVAARLAACRTESPRSDGLRITPAGLAA
jgi:hypothetical protein